MKISETERQLIKEALENGGSIDLDFSRDIHYRYYMDKAGGEEAFKRSFPAMYRNINRQRRSRLADREITRIITKKTDDSPGARKLQSGQQDTVIIAPPSASTIPNDDKKMNARSALIGEFRQSKPAILAQSYVVDMDTGEMSYVDTQTYADLNRFAKAVTVSIRRKKTANLVSVGEVTLPQVTRGEPTLTTKFTASQNANVHTDGGISDGFTVIDPNKKTNANKDYIMVSYNRGHIIENADYSINNYPVDGKISLKLPVQIRLKVKQGYRIQGISKDDGWQLYFTTPKGGMLRHLASYNELKNYNTYYKDDDGKTISVKGIYVTEDARQIVITMPEDWKNEFDFSNLENKASVNLNIYGVFYIRIESVPKSGEVPFEISQPVVFASYDQVSGPFCALIKPLHFQWGCIDGDAGILLEDGSQRRIAELSIGDHVRNADGGTCEIRNISFGPEPTIYVLRTDAGKEVRLTGLHTIFTVENGAIPVQTLKQGDSVYTTEGVEKIESLYLEDYEKTVYNLEFSEPTAIYANLIKVGDFFMQQTIRAPEAEGVEEDNEEMREMAQELRLFCNAMRADKGGLE